MTYSKFYKIVYVAVPDLVSGPNLASIYKLLIGVALSAGSVEYYTFVSLKSTYKFLFNSLSAS